MGIRDRPTAPRAPSQNGHLERLVEIDSSRMCRTCGVRQAHDMFDGRLKNVT